MLRTLLSSALLSALVLASPAMLACKKTGGETETPTASEDAPAAPGMVELRYATAPYSLKSAGSVAMELAGMQSGNLAMKGEAIFAYEAAEDGYMKVVARVVSIDALEVDGALKEGLLGSHDVTALLTAVKGKESFYVVDMRGDTDDEKTKALPENVARAEQAKAEAEKIKAERAAAGDGEAPKGPTLDQTATGLASQFLDFMLPGGFPEEPMAPSGDTKLPLEQKDVAMFGTDIPMEIEQTYTLTPTGDGLGGMSMAMETISSGAKEMSQGGQSTFIAVDQESSGTLVLDDAGELPSAFKGDILMTLTFGENSIEQNISLDLSYTRL